MAQQGRYKKNLCDISKTFKSDKKVMFDMSKLM